MPGTANIETNTVRRCGQLTRRAVDVFAMKVSAVCIGKIGALEMRSMDWGFDGLRRGSEGEIPLLREISRTTGRDAGQKNDQGLEVLLDVLEDRQSVRDGKVIVEEREIHALPVRLRASAAVSASILHR